jgi:hypothetical protein
MIATSKKWLQLLKNAKVISNLAGQIQIQIPEIAITFK